jgi:hypothetical protein
MKFFIKNDRRFYKWENGKVTLLVAGRTRTLNLARFEVLKPLQSDIADCLGARFNSASSTFERRFYHFMVFERLLQKIGAKVNGADDLNVSLFSSAFATLRDNPQLVNIQSSMVTYVFQNIRIYYNWCLTQMKPGYGAETAKYLESVRFEPVQRAKSLKQMDPDTGPFSTLEMVTLDRFFTKQLNEWDELEFNSRSAVLTYWLSRETSRRSGELHVIDVDDLVQEGGLSYVFLAGRKPTDTRDKAKGKHRISNSLYAALVRYVDETNESRGNSQALLIQMVNGIYKRWAPDSLARPVRLMVKKAKLPNRRFFASNITSEDLVKPENKQYRLNYTASRARMSYGTHQALAKVPFEYLSVRMGHYNVRTTLKFYIRLTPENTSEILSGTVGVKYARFAEYFFGKPTESVEGEPVVVLSEPDSLVFGGCKASWCGRDPRIGCYLCDRFRPIISPEHEKNLAWLRKRREGMIETVDTAGGEPDETSLGYYLAQIDLAIAGAEHLTKLSRHEDMT